MPVKKVKGGYKWGSEGKVFPTKSQANAQGRAAYASGYKGKNNGNSIRKTAKSRGR